MVVRSNTFGYYQRSASCGTLLMQHEEDTLASSMQDPRHLRRSQALGSSSPTAEKALEDMPVLIMQVRPLIADQSRVLKHS